MSTAAGAQWGERGGRGLARAECSSPRRLHLDSSRLPYRHSGQGVEWRPCRRCRGVGLDRIHKQVERFCLVFAPIDRSRPAVVVVGENYRSRSEAKYSFFCTCIAGGVFGCFFGNVYDGSKMSGFSWWDVRCDDVARKPWTRSLRRRQWQECM